MRNTAVQSYNITEDLEKVRKIIISSADNSIPIIKKCISSITDSGGKMLRPVFLIVCSRIGLNDQEKIYKLAAAVELLHISSLIHDDIIDDADKRRGKPAVHKVYGIKNSVLIGDFLFSRSFSLLAENTSAENGASMAKIAGKICEGEIEQNISASIKDYSMRSYLRRITAKTAILFILSFHLGAVESGCSKELQSTLRKIGYNTGMAFQIIDDILDFTGSENRMGKPAGNDLKTGTITAPIIFAVRTDSSLSGRLRKKIPRTKKQTAGIIKEIINLGAIEQSRKLAAVYTERAMRELENLPEGYTRETLNKMIRDLLLRDY